MFWKNKDELARFVSLSLNSEIISNPQTGWVRDEFVKKYVNNTIEYSSSSCEYKKMIVQAKNSIFFSGIGMAHFDVDIANLLANVDTCVEITCVVSNSKSREIVGAFNSMSGLSYDEYFAALRRIFDRRIAKIREIRNINVDYINIFSPITYFAIDYRKITEFSIVQAKHYLLPENEGEDVFYCIARPGTELYKYYSNQISILERKVKEHKKMHIAPIPALIYVDELAEKYDDSKNESKDQSFILDPIIGEYFDIECQSYDALRVPITMGGNAIVYGSTDRKIRT